MKFIEIMQTGSILHVFPPQLSIRPWHDIKYLQQFTLSINPACIQSNLSLTPN